MADLGDIKDNIKLKAESAAGMISTASQMAAMTSVSVGGGILGFLKTANAALERIPGGILNYFDALADMGENISQAFVDSVCRYAAWLVNINIERIRQKVLKALYEQNIVVRVIVDILEIAKEVIMNPLEAIPAFFDRLLAPFKVAKQLITDIISELSKLAANVTKIIKALPPEPPNPEINFDEFEIKVYTFGPSALAPADKFPAPEVLFPEPPFPFSKEVFQSSFEEGKKAFTSNSTAQKVNDSVKQITYRPKKSAAMEGEIV